MAEGVEVQIVNEAAWQAALDAITHQLPDLTAPMTAAGTAALAAARAGAPRRTGAMAAAHTGRYEGRNRWAITVAHPGANAVHWGWPGHGIRRQPWVVARWWRDQTWADRLADGLQSTLDKEAGKVR